MSSLKYNPKTLKYYGESSYDTPSGLQVGDKAYFFNTEKNVVWDGDSWVDDKVNTDTTLETGDLEIGAVELKDATTDTRSTINADGSLNTSVTDIVSGTATSGSKSTIVDTTKNFITNMLTGTIAEVDIGSTKYFRKVLSNTSDTITIDTIAGAAASATLGSGDNGTVTITSVNDGIGGNSYTVQALLGVGNNVPLSALLTGLDLVVTLATNGGGTIDMAANTATLIATAIDGLAEFTAVASGTGSDTINGTTVINFTGGVAIVSVSALSKYKIKSTKPLVDSTGSLSSVVKQSTHDNLNANANMQVNNVDVSNTNPVNIKGGASKSSTSKTRPNNATPYSIGDVVGTDAATNLEFTSVSNISGGYVVITGASLEVDVNAVPSGMSSFRLHLYDAAPTAITDNLAYNLPSADRAKYLGDIEIYTPSDLGDTLWSRVDNVNLLVKLANGSTTLYGMLETRGAFTPTAQCVKVVTLNVLEV